MSKRQIAPVSFEWREVEVADHEDGVIRTVMAMVPVKRFRRFAGEQYQAGHVYRLGPFEEQSEASRGHFFACVHTAWLNLPETVTPRWKSETHMRRWILIRCGWYDEKEFELKDEEQAFRLGTFIRTEDPYASMTVHGNKLIVRRAMTQSPKAMGKHNFEASKQDVLSYLSNLIGVDVTTLRKESKNEQG